MIDIDNHYYKWQKKKLSGATLFFKGDHKFAQNMLNLSIKTDDKNLRATLKKTLKSLTDFTSGIIETKSNIILWTDHIRSWPIFYRQTGKDLRISNNARNLLADNSITINEAACLEFVMSGYINGADTMAEEIKCLEPGELLIWDKNLKKITKTRYHRYTPELDGPDNNWDSNREKLGHILDQITLKIINRANGRPIWIPLSGGLDSRIILCKLHEHGYKNMHTFSYGPRGNGEAKIAKQVAHKLGVPWQFLHVSKKQTRTFFQSTARKNYWSAMDGLKAIPGTHEFMAINALHEQKILPPNAILINGQSGDFITGGHIAKLWEEDRPFTIEDLQNILINKHYDLWQPLKTEQNRALIAARLTAQIGAQPMRNRYDFMALEEQWEYESRQICYVANGQRLYDYFGYDWELPLWEKTLVDFCESLPYAQKKGQALYKAYLKHYNYQNLFPAKEPYIWRWPPHMLWVVGIAQIIGLVKDKQAKHNFYALMRYHGHYSNQFKAFDWKTHTKTYRDTRNVVSLYVRQWVEENRNIIPAPIIEALKIDPRP